MSLVLVCGSRKPAPGLTSPSAAREMLKEIRRGVRATEVPSLWVDLRDYELPIYDGRAAAGYDAPDLERLERELCQATGFILATPAYWNSVSGVVKNLVDLLGDAPFRGKLVGLLVVGMDHPSAWHGAAQMRQIMTSLGAWCPPYQMVIGNPREYQAQSLEQLRRDLQRFGAYMGLLISGKTPAFPTIDQLVQPVSGLTHDSNTTAG